MKYKTFKDHIKCLASHNGIDIASHEAELKKNSSKNLSSSNMLETNQAKKEYKMVFT